MTVPMHNFRIMGVKEKFTDYIKISCENCTNLNVIKVKKNGRDST